MNYRNSEMKIDQLVAYLNDEKINLSPAFQRGHVWKLTTRKRLVKNIVARKPIPAVFLYKEASGSKYSYNILDGKQRLESLILFIGNERSDFKIPHWNKYFYGDAQRKSAHYAIETGEKKKRTFKQLDDDVVRDFREYAIPTIEITLDDESSLDEIITLFVDINQQGEPVSRFDIVKALCKTEPLLKSVFELLAQEERRGQDVLYKARQTAFSAVLKRLSIIEAIPPGNARVDRMWERLLELVLFARTGNHRKPVEILKEFMTSGKGVHAKISRAELKKLRAVFDFLRDAYKGSIGTSRLATDQTHFYTMVTSISRADLIKTYGANALLKKLDAMATLLGGAKPPSTVKKKFDRYQELSVSKTTDASRRSERDKLFVELVGAL
jgi:hypothetical protein